jgi:peptide deformylase
MMLPITAYGHPTLKKKGEEISKDYPNLDKLIDDMFETMYQSNGVGLAAHQINKAIRLFVVDASPYGEQDVSCNEFKKVFINAIITNEEGKEWEFEEGCLSVPGINEYVKRKPVIYISYYDDEWKYHENERYEGIIARIIQHEYDHTEGVVFIERLPNIRKVLLKRKLNDITSGKIKPSYKMIFPRKKNKR